MGREEEEVAWDILLQNIMIITEVHHQATIMIHIIKKDSITRTTIAVCLK